MPCALKGAGVTQRALATQHSPSSGTPSPRQWRALARQWQSAAPHRHRKAADGPQAIRWDIHGRHVDVGEPLRVAVIDRLSEVVHKMEGPEYLEATGGVSHVDVRLMNTSAEIRVHPIRLDKELHDTYLRQGELCASATGCNSAWECFEAAAQQLEKKLKPQRKPTPRKVDYRSF